MKRLCLLAAITMTLAVPAHGGSMKEHGKEIESYRSGILGMCDGYLKELGYSRRSPTGERNLNYGRISRREAWESVLWTWIEVKFSLDALLKARRAHA